MAGPGGVFNQTATTIPTMADNIPIRPAIHSTRLRRWESKRPVAAGVISMATTRITPTVCRLATTAKLSRSIRK